MTPSALSKRIQRLERQLGVTVVDRGPAGVLRVTTAGRRFADAAGPLLAHAATVRETARTRPDRYTVRIGFPGRYARVTVSARTGFGHTGRPAQLP